MKLAMNKGRVLILFSLLFALVQIAEAQYLKSDFNKASKEILKEDEARKGRVSQFLQRQSSDMSRVELKDGRVAVLVDIINNKPIYVAVYNAEAASSVGITELRAGGALGLNLTGRGLRVMVWDEPGGARATHQEFGERLTRGSDLGPGSVANHSSHVTGTVMASGVNPNAMGMAPEAEGIVYDFNSDIQEMVEEVTNNSEIAIVSNHSYGTVSGWNDGAWSGDENISDVEDWKFGFYNNGARQYDELVHNAPYYMIVKAAGNDRGDSGDGTFPPDGPYDIVSFTGTAKNIITVGATRKLDGPYEGPEDVSIAGFSSWGPTDDGRIKPDISAPGVAVLSSWAASDESYASIQGTSMATPVVTGGLTLIQELHQKLTGSLMKASAIKGLMIHTALEAGIGDGPDYEHGWGLFNAQGMARTLLEQNSDNKRLIMDVLADQETKEYTITPIPGTKVKATLVWTDVPGTPVAVQLDPGDLMLVNDLDMRAIGATETQMPWALRPSTPQQEAFKDDNFRDNVEKIEFVATDDSYTLSISHKDELDGSQEYALVIEYEKQGASNTFYWVGGNGEWSNTANWSLSSGGASAGMMPTANDNVVFDNNSFTDLGNEENFLVSLAENAEVTNFSFFSDKAGILNFAGNSLSLDGNLILSSDMVDVKDGMINFSGNEDEIVVRITSPMPTSEIVIDGAENTQFNFVGDVNVKSVRLVSGKLSINESLTEVESLEVSGGEFSVQNSELRITQALVIDNEVATINWSSANIVIPPDAVLNIDISGAMIPMDLQIDGEVTIANATGFRNLTLNGELHLNSNVEVESTVIGEGAQINLGPGQKLTINGVFESNGTDVSPIGITGDGTGELALMGHRKVCTDFVTVSGVNYTGESVMSIGISSEIGSNDTGWLLQACEDVLFADFNFQYACVNSMVFFTDVSSGNLQAWNWAFHDGAVSTSQNVVRPYTEIGEFDIALEISDGEANDRYETSITIRENELESNVIRANGNTLISQRGSTQHVWFRNGEIVEGENGQTLDTQGQGGTYVVLTFDENCNRISEAFDLIITSIDEEPIEQTRLEQAVTVFPNPTSNYVDINIEGFDIRTLSMELVNPNGRVIEETNYRQVNSSSFKERVQLSNRGSGFYIIKLLINDELYISRKVILAR